MPYDIMATGKTSALIIYLLDVSTSMSQPLGNKRRIDVVMDALTAARNCQLIYGDAGRSAAGWLVERQCEPRPLCLPQ